MNKHGNMAAGAALGGQSRQAIGGTQQSYSAAQTPEKTSYIGDAFETLRVSVATLKESLNQLSMKILPVAILEPMEKAGEEIVPGCEVEIMLRQISREVLTLVQATNIMNNGLRL